eukprot:gene22341-28461_t
MIWNHEVSSNLKEALSFLDSLDDGDGTFNFREIMSLHSKYPNTFFPIFRLQIHIIEGTLGTRCVNDDVVLKRMGPFKYYCMPWLRAQERSRISRIAAMESELDNFRDLNKRGE